MPDTYEALKRIRDLAKVNPAAFKAWLVRTLAKIAVVLILCFVSYMQGLDSKNNEWVAKIERQKREVADAGGKNAIEAGKRLGDYKYNDAQLDAAVAQAKQMVHDYYAKNPETVTVEKTKLVPVPGKPEYVYVPIDSCPSTFLNADELRLFNLGNKGDFADPTHPK